MSPSTASPYRQSGMPSYYYQPYPMYTAPTTPSVPPGGISSSPGGGINVPGMLPSEQSYIENIFRLNRGKPVTVYTTFENNREWNAKIFKGIIEAAGRDHLILSDPQTGMRYLILMVSLDYATFDEPIEYNYPVPGGAGAGTGGGLASYPPR
ncbi:MULTISPECIES: spore coat protein GerQ [Bacillaceae]|uniref:spore coat protein GerQ n=2 Tax=Bacillaceae TaxID=186817 RepID=UPI00217E56EC|nr:spore coat protein GerQ [Bacillus sp. PK3_68]